MRIIARKGEISLIQYDGGYYAVDFSNESLGQTLMMSKNFLLASEYYQKKAACVGAQTVSGKTNQAHYSIAMVSGKGERKLDIKRNLRRNCKNRHSKWTVFSDFLLMAATSISNSIDKRQFEPREKRYLETVRKYEKEELGLFSRMFAELVLELQKYAEDRVSCDVLGEIFHELELHNKWHGQFFSPQHVCDMMGEISIGQKDSVMERNDYVTVNEPCSGGGAMLFGFAKAFAKRGYSYCKQMLVEASDVDIKCVYMTYIQLSLYGIPAVVLHRNSLSMETWSVWYTPVYIVDGWSWRQRCSQIKQPETEPSNKKSEIIEETEQPKIYEPLTLF